MRRASRSSAPGPILEVLSRWWGPGEFTTPFVEVDLRPGGDYLLVMQPPHGDPMRLAGTFREVVAPERLVYSWRWAEGWPIPPSRSSPSSSRTWASEPASSSSTAGSTTAPMPDPHRMGWESGSTSSRHPRKGADRHAACRAHRSPSRAHRRGVRLPRRRRERPAMAQRRPRRASASPAKASAPDIARASRGRWGAHPADYEVTEFAAPRRWASAPPPGPSAPRAATNSSPPATGPACASPWSARRPGSRADEPHGRAHDAQRGPGDRAPARRDGRLSRAPHRVAP